jgi:hypothetical protein
MRYRLDNIRLRFRDPGIERIFARESLRERLVSSASTSPQ